MLGLKEYFGNVDHLRVAISEVPIPDADYRKQYLVIYDSVPGGTGYLKQLMNNEGSLTTIFVDSSLSSKTALAVTILRRTAAITACLHIDRAIR